MATATRIEATANAADNGADAPAKASAPKAKAGQLCTDNEDVAPFGFKINDIVRTPLGIRAVVIGVKYDDVADKSSGRLWVEYGNGSGRAPLCSPLEPRLGAGKLSALGYTRMSETDHLWRDIRTLEGEKAARVEKEAEINALIARLKDSAAAADEEMDQPAPKGPK